jgi:hypothetical protein
MHSRFLASRMAYCANLLPRAIGSRLLAFGVLDSFWSTCMLATFVWIGDDVHAPFVVKAWLNHSVGKVGSMQDI